MTALPAKTSISDTYPLPSNATARAGFAQLWDAINEMSEKSEMDLAAAATTDIGGQTSRKLRFTGSGWTVTSFGINYTGPILIRVGGAGTITQNATTLLCPGATNLTVLAGDVLMAWAKATTSGTLDGWQVVRLARGDGVLSVAEGGTGAATAAAARTALGLAYGPAFSAYAAVDQTGISSGVATKVTLGSEEWDTASCFASNRFTPNVAGYYQINGAVRGNSATMTEIIAVVYKNGSAYQVGQADVFASTNGSMTASVSTIVSMNGSTDYVELYGQVTGGTPKFAYTSTSNTSRFSGGLLRSA